MWADNETNVDLLGFDYLVDSLDVLLTQPGLLPLTVGVLGDWGSGKTSLLRMAQERLKPADGYLTVFFSPWRYEDYEDVKGALIDAILSRLEEAIPEGDEDMKAAVRRLRRMARRLGAGTAGALKVVIRPAVTFAAQHYGAPPEVAALMGEAATAAVDAATPGGESAGPTDTAPTVIESVTCGSARPLVTGRRRPSHRPVRDYRTTSSGRHGLGGETVEAAVDIGGSARGYQDHARAVGAPTTAVRQAVQTVCLCVIALSVNARLCRRALTILGTFQKSS
jgi:hypothetical protein